MKVIDTYIVLFNHEKRTNSYFSIFTWLKKMFFSKKTSGTHQGSKIAKQGILFTDAMLQLSM